MSKAKYIDVYNGGKHCTRCGKRNIPYPTGNFDSETGLPEAEFACNNSSCSKGRISLAGCATGHNYVGSIFGIFGSLRCSRCGGCGPVDTSC